MLTCPSYIMPVMPPSPLHFKSTWSGSMFLPPNRVFQNSFDLSISWYSFGKVSVHCSWVREWLFRSLSASNVHFGGGGLV